MTISTCGAGHPWSDLLNTILQRNAVANEGISLSEEQHCFCSIVIRLGVLAHHFRIRSRDGQVDGFRGDVQEPCSTAGFIPPRFHLTYKVAEQCVRAGNILPRGQVCRVALKLVSEDAAMTGRKIAAC